MMKQSLVFGILLAVLPLHHASEWGYRGPHGPSNWPTLFPDYCSHSDQSPINIDSTKAERRSDAGRIQLTGFRQNDIPSPSSMQFLNNGHTLEVSLTGDFTMKGVPHCNTEDTYQAAQFHFHWGSVNTQGSEHTVNGRAYPAEGVTWNYSPLCKMAAFQAAQFHFHWGSVNTQGSEHTVNGRAYPAEMHIVHWNKKYTSFDEALTHKDGLAVLGVFLEGGAFEPNLTFEELVKVIGHVSHKGQTYTFPKVFAIADLMPDHGDLSDYFFYNGSLTTPTCNEVVQWILFKEPLEVSWQQLMALRSVFENEEGEIDVPLFDNFRPT